MYDKRLANRILEKLEEMFPQKAQLDELRQTLPGFDLPEQEWLLAADALIKMGHATGKALRAGMGDVPRMVMNLEITHLGREELRSSKQASSEESGDLDGLLPILARRQFDADWPPLTTGASESAPLCLILADIDHFKAVNDGHGHTAGDEVLIETASAIKSVCKGKGRCYRLGGDELAVLLPNCNTAEGQALAERLRDTVGRISFAHYPAKITLSIGVASYPGSCASGGELYACADRAMYEAKQSGRDWVSVAGSVATALPLTPRPSPAEIERRLGKVRLWVRLRSGRAANFLLDIENKSDEELRVEEIRLESGGCTITEPAFCPAPESWRIAPRASLPIGWICQTDPAASLTRMHDHEGLFFKADLRVVLVCSVLGQSREFHQLIPVQVNATNRQIFSLL
jgi:diguanylate cyclase (GGDEF)-like protein